MKFACVHAHACTLACILHRPLKYQYPPVTHEILPHAKNQPNRTSRSDFMDVFKYASEIYVFLMHT